MKRNLLTKPSGTIACLTSGLLFAIVVVAPLISQSADESRVYYDVNREVTLSGTVSGVLSRPMPGMMWGAHLLVTTTSGTLDASLGRWGLMGKGGFSVSIGQQVELTGVMKTMNSKEVLVVRTVKVNGTVYTIRDEQGTPVSPQARELIGQKGDGL